MRRPQHLGCLDQGERSDRGHPLCAVDERQPLLGLKLKRRHAVPAHEIRGEGHASVHPHFPLADHAHGQVRERDEVAARAQRAAGGNDREDLRLDHAHEMLEQREPDPAVAQGERVGAEREHEPHDPGLELGTRARGVAADEVQLQLLDLLGGNTDRLELPEARVHPVDGAPLLQHALDERA